MADHDQIVESFSELAERIRSKWVHSIPLDSTFAQQFGRQYTPLTPENVAYFADAISERIDIFFKSNTHSDEILTLWYDIGHQADFLTFDDFSSDPNGCFSATMYLLNWASSNLPPILANVDWEAIENKEYLPRTLSNRLKGVETRVSNLNQRSEDLQESIRIIEDARTAADRLPTDIEELRKARDDIKIYLASVTKDKTEVSEAYETSKSIVKILETLRDRADALVKKCDESYRITTSAGLAGAFNERSNSLQKTGWVWVVILIASLILGSLIGAWRFSELMRLMGDGSTVRTSIVVLHFIGALMGVGAAIWIAWVSTKNVTQSFRLSEDYAFKSSISKAYEGYRREAIDLDGDFAKQLFGSALTRLDEQPSRFIDMRDHASPFEALLDNKAFQELIKSVPEAGKWVATSIADGKTAVGAVLGASSAFVTKKSETDKVPDHQQDAEPKNSAA
ncbi:hypothetical protein KCX83_14180 [Brucella oryzae]|uniref:hypothetical protein n=1 Tax=Brucella oryzae TaxID=335286 RepID=UPI001B817D87|nr:hypothetical protein [Brucella oryzae]MBR7653468.1 hypothetical protein [Brucella oryzae]